MTLIGARVGGVSPAERGEDADLVGVLGGQELGGQMDLSAHGASLCIGAAEWRRIRGGIWEGGVTVDRRAPEW